jgi:hypothetical protein
MGPRTEQSPRDLGWRAPILQHFTPEIALTTRLTVVADPDHLLTEQTILGELQRRGFDLIAFDDHVAFRLAYESRYRRVWDRGEKTNLVVVLRGPSGNLDEIPYDLLTEAREQQRCLSFSVGELFPTLAPNVVLSLDRTAFDELHSALAQEDPTRLGEDATKDFILRHVFAVAPELIKTPASLLQVLLRRHYRGALYPSILDDRFITTLRRNENWEEWPLEEIVPSRTHFLDFLQERWPHFLRKVIHNRADSVLKRVPSPALRYRGPVDIPFGHDDVKVYIDNLFQEGQLKPCADFTVDQLPESWMRLGVARREGPGVVDRFEPLTRRVETDLPGEDSMFQDWIDYSRTWAEWSALRWSGNFQLTAEQKRTCEQFHDRMEERFAAWMLQNYATLHNVSYTHRPAMVHHVAHHMAQFFVATGAQSPGSGVPRKHVLIVVDGLAMDQWVHLRDASLPLIGEPLEIEENGCLAWVPTWTSVSRQAIFAGVEPQYFESSLGTTTKEPAHWRRFWEDRGARRAEVGYVREGKGQEDTEFLRAVLEEARHPKMRMLGVVLSKVDQTMHGVQTGSGGMHALVRHWAQEGHFGRMLKELLDLGYDVALTSDHGNIHGAGMGKPNVGAVAEERGERAHVFPDRITRKAVAEDYPEAIVWPPIGLPESWHVLLAPKRKAFLPVGKQTLGHGGIAMEEVIVPFIKIRRSLP